MVIGIVGAVLAFIPIIGLFALPLAVLAIVFGIVGLRQHGRRTSRGKGPAITGIVLGGLSFVLVGIGIAVLSDAFVARDGELQELDAVDEPVPSPEAEAAGETDTVEDAPAEAAEDADAGAIVEDAEPPAEASTEDAPIGTTRTVGDYEVTVTGFTADATEAVMAENPFNDPPTNGQYALVTFDVTYVGEDDGDPGMDLSAVLVTSGVLHADFDCMAFAPGDAFDAPTLQAGGSASGLAFCLDHPGLDPGSRLFFEDLQSWDADRVYWTIP
jgi:hypothetical protein